MRADSTVQIAPTVAVVTEDLKAGRKVMTTQPHIDIATIGLSMISSVSIHVIDTKKDGLSFLATGTNEASISVIDFLFEVIQISSLVYKMCRFTFWCFGVSGLGSTI